MIDLLRFATLDLLVVLGGALALAVVLRFASAALDALSMSRARRALVARLSPLAGVALTLIYVVLAIRWLLRTDDRRAWLAFTAVMAVAVAVSWAALRDVFEGIYLRVGQTCVVGDRVQIGAVRGRIRRLGLRGLVVEGSDGELAIVPYRTVAAQPILRTPGIDRAAAFHVFRVRLPEHQSIPDARRAVREAALLSHWSSVARHPQVVSTDSGELEITVFAIDPDRAPDIERELRRALGA